MTLLTLALSLASAADYDALLSSEGWEPVGEGSTKQVGTVALALKVISGERCLRGSVTTDVAADVLYEVITDVPSTDGYTREKLLASRVLGTDGDKIHYYQHLDVPNWTMAADRFWVLAGHRQDQGAAIVYLWDRFEWRSVYPGLAAELAADHPDAVEPVPNFGAWRFVPTEAGSVAEYILCSDPGGSLPDWIVRAGATRTFPNTISDVVVEGRRRAAAR